jgi:hypothetical protein
MLWFYLPATIVVFRVSLHVLKERSILCPGQDQSLHCPPLSIVIRQTILSWLLGSILFAAKIFYLVKC